MSLFLIRGDLTGFRSAHVASHVEADSLRSSFSPHGSSVTPQGSKCESSKTWLNELIELEKKDCNLWIGEKNL